MLCVQKQIMINLKPLKVPSKTLQAGVEKNIFNQASKGEGNKQPGTCVPGKSHIQEKISSILPG